MSEELKACPFECDENYLEVVDESKDLDNYIIGSHCYVECDCGATGPRVGTKQEAIKAWNTRASDWVSVEDRLPEYYQDVWVTDGISVVASRLVGRSYTPLKQVWANCERNGCDRLVGIIKWCEMIKPSPPEDK